MLRSRNAAKTFATQSGVKRTRPLRCGMSAYDPKRTTIAGWPPFRLPVWQGTMPGLGPQGGNEWRLRLTVSPAMLRSRRRGNRMRWKKPIAVIENGASVALISLTLIAFPSSSANAERPPHKGCVVVSKGEYQGAKRKKLLNNRFGTYVRTGRLWRRLYWYCR